MFCKFCGAQLEEEATFCPVCNKELVSVEEQTVTEEVLAEEVQAAPETTESECNAAAEALNAETESLADAEETEVTEASDEEAAEDMTDELVDEDLQPNKPKAWKIILAIVGGVVLLGVLVCAVLYRSGVDFKPRANDIKYKDSYTISADKAQKLSDEPVATVEDHVLDNAQLQIHYNMTINDFVSYYGYYLTTIGLDTTKAYDAQQCPIGDNVNWQQYFLNNALSIWHRYTVLNLMAQEEGYTLEESMQAELDKIPEKLQTWAEQYGYADAEAMLQADFGPLCTMDAYTAYMKAYYLAMQYQDEKYSSLEPTAEEVETYFTNNEATFSEKGITKDGGSYYDVRHILIEPEGGTTDDTGLTTYSDEEWAACLAKAEELLEQWKTDSGTESGFAALAAIHSTDTGSSSNGGLYSQLTSSTNFVDSFKDWYLAEGRQPGDTGIVKSTYGYHIMYFSASEPIWQYNAKTTLLSEKWSTLIEEGMAKWPMTVNYKKIALCDAVEEETAETTEATEVTQDTTAATQEATVADTTAATAEQESTAATE